MSKEYVITDSKETIIERVDIEKKINKINLYVKKTVSRIQELDKKLEKIHLAGAKQSEIKKGLEWYQLNDNISKEV